MNQQFIDSLTERAKAAHKRIAFPEADCADILRCAEHLLSTGIADVTLVGDPEAVRAPVSELLGNILMLLVRAS